MQHALHVCAYTPMPSFLFFYCRLYSLVVVFFLNFPMLNEHELIPGHLNVSISVRWKLHIHTTPSQIYRSNCYYTFTQCRTTRIKERRRLRHILLTSLSAQSPLVNWNRVRYYYNSLSAFRDYIYKVTKTGYFRYY